jgi:spermidine synthase
MSRGGNPGDPPAASRFVAPLSLLLVASGCAALIYELVWFQLLRQVIGASAISLAIVLTSFMGGMCLGSLGFPRWISTAHHPLRVYAYLEAGIGALGIALLGVLPLVGMLYVAVVGYGPAGILFRALICLICLLPPTVLMGATLPAISRWLQTTRGGTSRMGLFYAANIVGGVAGCLLAGFFLLRVYDLYVATFVAVGLNAAVAAVSLTLASRASFDSRAPSALALPSVYAHRAVYIVIALSGLTSLGAQVVWTRLLSLVFGATVYTFTIILAVFLTGLGIGSAAGSFLIRHVRSPRAALGWCQLSLAAAIPFCAYMICLELPYWQLNPEFRSNLGQRYLHDLVRGILAMLPATCLWGASFPLALAAAAEDGQEPGHLVGGLYAANTAGAILGALLFSMVMIPGVGTQGAQQILTLVAGATASLMLWPRFSSTPGARPASSTIASAGGRWGGRHAVVAALSVVAFVALMVWMVPAIRANVIAYGRDVALYPSTESYLFVGEGSTSSIAVSEDEDFRYVSVSGKVVASSGPDDMRVERMLGHLPALLHPHPKSVLIVGFGAGVTAGSFVLYPEVERIVICEIEPLVPKASGEHFAPENYDVLNDPRVEMIYDDGRHFIATTEEKFDIITSDPIHPWMNGSASLFTIEYYELAKQRLNEGGFVTQWVPLIELDEATVKSLIGTFLEVFPEGTLWSNHIPDEGGSDIIMIGQVAPLSVDAGDLTSRIEENPALETSLAEVKIEGVLRLLAAYVGEKRNLAQWLEDAQINRERNLRLQYLAGLSLDLRKHQEIYRTIVQYRSYPDHIFTAPEWMERRLRGAWN